MCSLFLGFYVSIPNLHSVPMTHFTYFVDDQLHVISECHFLSSLQSLEEPLEKSSMVKMVDSK